MSCPLCNQRKPKRFCPAEGEKICAVCCGINREVTIECPSDCAHLIAARRFEHDHRPPLPADQVPFPKIHIPSGMIDKHQEPLIMLAQALVDGAFENHATDDDVLTALTSMVETYRTLESGILYERAPDGVAARHVYSHLTKSIEEYKAEETERFGFPKLKDNHVISLLLFLLRVGKQETNGRPKSRGYLDFLHSSLPRTKSGPEPSRILTA